MDAARLRDFATRYTAAWCSQHAASVAAHFAADGTLTINGGTPSVGRAAIAASPIAWRRASSPPRRDPRRFASSSPSSTAVVGPSDRLRTATTCDSSASAFPFFC